MTPLDEARRIVAAVRGLPEVADVHSGEFGRVATLGAGGRVGGVRVTEEDVTVGVTVRAPFSAADVAAAVRAAVASGRPVHVVIADVEVPASGETEPGNRKETVS
ncbi:MULTISPECIES: hypothetical protein [Amycolatopsis]|uniref:Asp23/Gls24 family envelope stress response protein n=1 Tax=Amycolatopsis dendrobii TaxID=2760662 RepID=A0A7W3W417_9PSEU|nr:MULTISPECIES: hypothetical protein [Amycolatopsis]MBB1158329.1 hypothetical protein [Amycolatopsis dendrobii]UKD56830.1 hypothetical protein L3Q65_08945 [Amycolatopsis sp. FU40]